MLTGSGPAISSATPADYAALDAYVAAVAVEVKVNGYEAISAKQEFGGNVTPDGVNTSPNIGFPAYAYIVSIPLLGVGMMLSIANYKEFSGGDPVKEARRRIELAGGTLRPAVVATPAPPPPARTYELGIPFVDPLDGLTYVWKDWPFGPPPLRCRVAASIAAPVADTPESRIAGERAEFTKYLQRRLVAQAQPQDVVDELIAGLVWVANRPK